MLIPVQASKHKTVPATKGADSSTVIHTEAGGTTPAVLLFTSVKSVRPGSKLAVFFI